ncbi:MAG: hypothetical protein H0X25_07475 [Acidobacteriales bacterium]|nr:hypothetical protein [Terriglobales bacterium]
MRSIDLRSVLLARHAQHVVVVHFPIALFLVGTLFDVAACRWERAELEHAAHLNLLAAAVSAPFVVATGIAAWRWQLGGQRLHGTLLYHLALGCLSGALICLVAGVRQRSRRKGVGTPLVLIVLELAAAALVTVTAHLGGIVSGVNLPSM